MYVDSHNKQTMTPYTSDNINYLPSMREDIVFLKTTNPIPNYVKNTT
jgi:hypothetical protein